MSVEVSPITMAGSPPVNASFSDTWNRASGALGTNWMHGTQVILAAGSPAQAQGATIGASLLDGLQCMIQSPTNGGANPVWVMPGFVMPLSNYPAIVSRNQFVQSTIVNATGAGAERSNCGLCAMLALNTAAGSTFSCYYLEALPQINVLQTGRVLNGAFNFGAPFGAVAGGVANGDILRMGVDIQAGQVVLTISKNGTVVGTVTDNGAGRLTVGTVGYVARGSGGVAPGRHEWRNFSCGLGTS